MEQDQISSAVDSIASDIGLGSGEDDTVVETTETAEAGAVTTETETTEAAATPNATTDPKKAAPATDTTTAATAAAPATRAAPKAWAKEQHERWGKLDKETQDYIEHREKQMLEGLSQYSEKAKRADVWEGAVKPYLPMIHAQGAQPHEAVTYLFEAHRQLSSGSHDERAAYLVKVAESYGIDISKAAAGAGAAAAAAAQEPAAVKELRERTERLERDRKHELDQRVSQTKTRVESEVLAFAEAKDEKGNPKHPYFDECAEDIVALINAGHALDKAYEKAVYANPVTREKELARLQTEREAALREKAKQEAERSRNASRTNVNSRDTRRTPTAPTAKKWEDTLDATMEEIKARRSTH